MADTIKSSNELKMVFGFYDGDTRTHTEENPRSDLGKTHIKELEDVMVTTQPVIGDKGGAQFVGINSAKVIEKTKIYVDLS